MKRSTVYAGWMALNSWATSTTAVLSTNSMLSSIMTPSYPSVITATYIGKDIVGQLGGLIFAWKTGKKADKQPLGYASKGVAIQQVAYYLENSSSLFPSGSLLPILGISSAMKNISFITIGSVNANVLQNLAKNEKGGIGEFYSKIASINTLASTLGMLSGIALIYSIPSYTIRTGCVMPILSFISFYSMKEAIRSVGSV